jgi:nucleoside-diphosphate-sugar epimerase
MNTVLVTGAGGFIGGYVAGEFAARGWRICGTVHRRPPRRLPATTTLLPVDIADAGSMRRAVQVARAEGGGRLDAVVHCAGRASDIGWRRTFAAVNAGSVRHLVGLVREYGIGRLVFISTTDVYGLRDQRGQDEEALPLDPFPRNPYPVYKAEAEVIVREALPAERFAILRPAQVWGVGDPTLTARIERFLRHSPWIVHFGPWRGANRWPLAHVRNVARASFLAATRPEAAGRAINVLDSEMTSIDEFYRIVADVFLPGKRFRTVCLPLWIGAAFGAIVTGLSNVSMRDHPLADPSHYAVYAVSRNLDFSNRRFLELMAAAGERPFSRDEGIAELRRHVQAAKTTPR